LFANTCYSFHPIVEIPILPLKTKSIALPAHAGGSPCEENVAHPGPQIWIEAFSQHMYALYSIAVGAIWSKSVKTNPCLGMCARDTLSIKQKWRSIY